MAGKKVDRMADKTVVYWVPSLVLEKENMTEFGMVESRVWARVAVKDKWWVALQVDYLVHHWDDSMADWKAHQMA